MKRLRRIFVDRGTSTASQPTCLHDGCSAGTKNRKRYCTDHICETDYARELTAQLKQREEEIKSLNKKRALAKDSHLVKEAIAVLWEERHVTAPGLCRHMGLTHSQARHLLRQVAKHGLADLYENKRKKLCAKAVLSQEDSIR